MAAPSKTFTVIADSDTDAESPIDTDLVTSLRDNDIHLEEWLGKNFIAAVDHDHDGVNSAFVSSVLETEQATTSGTEKDFTGIPSSAKKITVMFVGVSLTGNRIEIQLGDSGGFETSGYIGNIAVLSAASQTAANFSSGFTLGIASDATATYHGTVTLTLEDAANNTWVATINLGLSDRAQSYMGGGSKSLSGVLTQISIKSENGSDTFDAGAVNILIET